MNCYTVLSLLFGEENLNIIRCDEGTDAVAGKINILNQWEVLYGGGGLFAVTTDFKIIIVVPTLASTDPLHLAIAIHEAHHVKRWLKHRRLPKQKILLWLEEKRTNEEATAFAKTIATGETLEEMLGVFKTSSLIYNPLFAVQCFIVSMLMRNRWIHRLTFMALDHQSRKKTGEDYTTLYAKRQSRLMNVPELSHEKCERCQAEEAA
jgi:hypothetical protein